MHCQYRIVKSALGLSCSLAAGISLSLQTAHAREKPGKPLQTTFFFTPGCRLCRPTKEAVRQSETRYGTLVDVEWVDLSCRETGSASAKRLFRMLNEYGEKSTPPLSLFAGGTCLAGGKVIIEKIDDTIRLELARQNAGPTARPLRLDRLGFWTVTAAALADGVNPCAFATVVLLVSMMAAARKSRQETLVIGAAFTGSVYVTYLVIGLALFGVLNRLRSFLIISDLVFYAAFGACVIFGLLSFYDATLAWRKKEPGQMLLKVPGVLRDRMRKRMRAGIRSPSMVIGVVFAGVVVSLLESACTGQVYFPVIAGLVRTEGARARGIGLLAWYNLLFVLPLMAVFALALAGVTSERLASFGSRHWGTTKLVLAFVFLAMAWWMAPELVWPPGVR